MSVGTRFVEGAEHEFQIVRTQDVEPILDYAKGMHNIGAGNGEDKLAAEIPFVLVEKYMADNNITWREFVENPAHIKRMCNDPALKDFRIWPGAL
jgi:hypothetical protein